MQRVLVACEFSGRVRDAFRRRGLDAWSCDLLPPEDGSPYHIQGDVRDTLDGDWAMVSSTNLDDRSFHLNFEINMATSHGSLCADLGRTFEEWVAGARRISPADISARSFSRRLVESACRTLSPVL